MKISEANRQIKTSQWATVIQEQQASGLSKREWYMQHGIKEQKGNCYNGEKIVGDYKCNDLLEIADTFTQFDWANYYRNIWIAEENM